jgi:hypothetical protein
MPMVEGKKFPYTPAGIKAAKKAAKKKTVKKAAKKKVAKKAAKPTGLYGANY